MRIWLAGLALALSVIACSSSLQKTSRAGDEPPKGAAGFDFGAAPSDVKKACEGAGKTWSSVNNESGTCSGPAADFGFAAPVRVDFCNKMSCVIAIEHRPKSNWLAAFNDAKQKLAKEHGTPSGMPTNGIPQKCSNEEQFARCLEVDGLRQEYRWQWPTRQQITFTVGKPEGGAGRAAIRIEYVTPPTGAR